MNKNNLKTRKAIIKIPEMNYIIEDNEELGVKAGDVVKYTLEKILYTIDVWQLTKNFEYYIIEHNDDGDKHWHIVLAFPNNSICRFNTIRNKFPYGNIDICQARVKTCVRFFVHADYPEKEQYSWDNIITNAPDKLESYKTPVKTSVNAKT